MTCLLFLLPVAAFAENFSAPAPEGLRPAGTLGTVMPAPKIADQAKPGRQVRLYPEQPPVIPHSIRDYQLDRFFNKCLSCHSRVMSPDTGAPMISITHFSNQDGQTLAAVSPRRYFCTQCHVPQHDVTPLVENNFLDVEEVLRRSMQKETD
ncbi:MAG: nitrate reductase cytochrome c-type subunit [Ketobacteraceae bacterium]|nr:nitrate reductase cytochrome c-type subunit [Ketobacteraceae bacterium]